MPLLRNASISFHTNGDDKDSDTHVTVTVRDRNNVIAARIDSDFGHFDDNSDNGPFGLVIRNQSSNSDLQSGSVALRIDPNGHDTWKFNFYLDLWFDDGSHLSGEADGLVLTQDNRDASFGLEGFLRRV
ncbi:hypothetical protein [Burkholderia pseudomallei]|uniref:hypothetical protein n=1 Tax=Burkholderia pseudomallei TaxID=28450 RepID=UPI0012F490B2|nr:hypothetical protein [Burkholderia pseudomallei]